jgi:rod shape-determining protein MreB and related proteins
MPEQEKKNGFNLRLWRRDLAVDLGTANTLIFMPRRGVVLQEPSVVAVRNGTLLAAGKKAHRMLGRTPVGIEAIKPLQGGVIADYEMARRMLEYFIGRVLKRFPLLRLRIIITVPYGTTQVERRAVIAAGKRSGVKDTYLIEEPIAAAIGSGLPVSEPRGIFVINFGGGVTELAVISLGGIVLARSLRQGGETIDQTIQRYIHRRYRMEIGLSVAEEAKRQVGYAIDPPEGLSYTFRGINLHRRMPDQLEIQAKEVSEAINPVLSAISGAAQGLFEKIPPQLAADVMQDGILLVGGGALLPNMDLYLSRNINLPVRRAADPFTCVVQGASMALQYIERLELQHN